MATTKHSASEDNPAVTPAFIGPTGTYTVYERLTTAVTGRQVLGGSRDAAIATALQAAATGPTGTEGHVWQCDLTGATGSTGIYAATTNTTGPLTGATFSANSHEDACRQAVAAGPVGAGAGIDIWRTDPRD